MHLQSQVAKYTHNTMLKMSPVFESMPETFIQLLALKLEQYFTMPDEVIYSVAEPATELYFIRCGTVVILKPSFAPGEKAPFAPSVLMSPSKQAARRHSILGGIRRSSAVLPEKIGKQTSPTGQGNDFLKLLSTSKKRLAVRTHSV